MGPATSLQQTVRAPRRSSHLLPWAVMAIGLLVACPALFLELFRPGVTDVGEARAVITALHTLGHHDLIASVPGYRWQDACVPYRDGRAHWETPPALAWVQALMLRVSPEGDGSSIDALERLRVGAALAGMVVLAATFWAGFSLGGLRAAVMAMAVCLSNPVFIYHARLASAPIHLTAWATLAVASALWALRPMRPAPSLLRQALGWTLCGLATLVANLTVGPPALAIIVFPIILLVILCPNRISHLLGLVAATMISIVGVMPWALYAHEQHSSAWPIHFPVWLPQHWFDRAAMFPTLSLRTFIFALALFPWTLWLIGAILQPFSTSSAGVRTRLFIGWGWFMLALTGFLTAPSGIQRTGLVVALPVTAILLSQLFEQCSELAAAGRFPRIWRTLRWPHLIVSLTITIALPWALANPDAPWVRQFTATTMLAPTSVFAAILIAAALLAILALSLRYAVIKEYPTLAVVAWSAWSLALSTTLITPLARGPAAFSPLRPEAHVVAALSAETPVLWLSPLADVSSDEPDPRLALYADKPITMIKPDMLQMAGKQNEAFFLLTRPGYKPSNDRLHLQFRLESAGLELWRFDPQLEPPTSRPTGDNM